MEFAKRITMMTPSATLKITALAKAMRQQGVDVVNLSSGEPDFDTPEHIKQAAITAIKDGFTKYTDSSGIKELKDAICKRFKEDNGLDYIPEQIVVSCGAKHSLYNVIQVLCQAGDEVIIFSPYWVSYPEIVKSAEAAPIIISAIDELEKSITKSTKLIIINSPSNPTGKVIPKEDLEKIAKIAVANNIYVVSDEIYNQITYDEVKAISIASLNKEIYEKTITVNGVSKAYSMTGWRIGYLAADKEIAANVKKLQSQSTSNPDSISQKAACAALSQSQDCIKEMVKAFTQRRKYLVDRLNTIKGFKCIEPKGAFYVFCNISETGFTAADLADNLLKQAKVAIIPGEAFGSAKYIRLSFAASMDEIKKGVDRIETWINNR